MLSNQLLKKKLQLETERLSGQSLQEVLAFIRYLRFKESEAPKDKISTDLETAPDPQDDPILQLIGIADVEPFSQDIDKILYDSV